MYLDSDFITNLMNKEETSLKDIKDINEDDNKFKQKLLNEQAERFIIMEEMFSKIIEE